MTRSLEQVQQWVKAWVVDVDPEVEVQVLPPHDNPREKVPDTFGEPTG